MTIYNQVENFVKDTFDKAGDDHGFKHLLRTAFWVKKLRPSADEALLVAAVSHDIERGFRNHDQYSPIKNDAKGFKSEAHLAHHQGEGARIIGEYLEKIGASREFVDRVKMLVEKHEVGGNDDQNLLKDADSISFFENNVDHFLKSKVLETGKDKVKVKFDWMFERITSDKAKQIAKDWYDKAIRELDSLIS